MLIVDIFNGRVGGWDVFHIGLDVKLICFFCQICKEHQLINDTSNNDMEHRSVEVAGADVHNGVSNNITSNQHLIKS